MIPDIPWILQRAAWKLIPSIDIYALRLYCVNQASLFVSLMFCAAVAQIMVRRLEAFLILSLGSLLHLLLDACQIKWANGVSLFVPLEWKLVRFDFFWPESPYTVVLTVAGLAYFLFHWRVAVQSGIELTRKPSRWVLSLVFLAAYLLLPTLWIGQALTADNHFVGTLHPENIEERAGRTVELDRIPFQPNEDAEGEVRGLEGEPLRVEGIPLDHDAKVSVRGTFTDQDRIVIEDYHVHHGWLREVASYVGLVLVGITWIFAIIKGVGRQDMAMEPRGQ
ncbi:hypothetical protein [Haloferula sp.]|uniref:hypothetical protein n=1 Tax=Haloferula sp. TaxID=2497595 RepID=UPI003C7095EC